MRSRRRSSRCWDSESPPSHLRTSTTDLRPFFLATHSIAETIGQQVFFPVSNAPAFRPTRGYVWGICWAIVEVFWSGALIPLCIAFFSRRDRNRGRRELLEENEQDRDADDARSSSRGVSEEVRYGARRQKGEDEEEITTAAAATVRGEQK